MKEKIVDTIKSLLALLVFMIIIILLSSFDAVEDEEVENKMIKEAQVQRIINIESHKGRD